MKKIVGLCLSFAMLFSLAACGSKINDDALDAFEDGIINISKIESTDFLVGINLVSGKDETAFNLAGTVINKNANPQLSLSVDAELEGVTQEGYIQIFLNDNTMYMNMMDLLKQKSVVDMSSVTNMKAPVVKKGSLKDSGIKDYLKEATLKNDKLTLVFDGEKLNGEMKEAIKKDTSGMSALLGDAKFNEIKVISTLKNKQISAAEITLDMSMEVDGEVKSTQVVLSFELKNINKAKDIVFPDFTDYIEADSTSSLLGQ